MLHILLLLRSASDWLLDGQEQAGKETQLQKKEREYMHCFLRVSDGFTTPLSLEPPYALMDSSGQTHHSSILQMLGLAIFTEDRINFH